MALRSVRVGLVLMFLVPGSVGAAEVTVKNDSLDNGSPAAIQAGFAANERAAAWLTTPCTGNIVALQLFWTSVSGGTGDTLGQALTVYADGTFPVPGAVLLQLDGPVVTDGYMNEFRYVDQQGQIPISIPVTAGQRFVLAFQFDTAPDPTNGPSLVTDTDGCQASKNGIFAIPPSSWFNGCSLGISGDFVIRAVVDGPTCGGGSGTGACCLGGTCFDGQTPAQCASSGGTYQGDNTTCVNVSCPPTSGACCEPGGTCSEGTYLDCQSAGGTFQGNGTVCSGVNCTAATGACCDGGICTDGLTAQQCAASGGTYQGDGTLCANVNCPPATGACCEGGICTDGLTAQQCASTGGTYQGDGTLCANVDCGAATGACCDGAICTDGLTASQCGSTGGTYQGDGTTCGTVSCTLEEEDFLVGRGLGQPNPNEVRVFRDDGQPTPTRFNAYAAGAWGVNVAAGDVDGAAAEEILTGPGPGTIFGPQVRGFQSSGSPISKINFYAYGTLKYGVNVASFDADGDAFREMLTGAGPGDVFGPHVRGFNFDGAAVSPIAKVNFFAYSTLKYGVNVAEGDVDGDAFSEILTGPGPGTIFPPQVRGFNYDGTNLTAIAKINFNAFSVSQYGVNVAGGDVDADTFGEIACTPGPGPGAGFPSEFVGFNYDGSSISSLPNYFTTPYTTTYGGRVALGDVDGDGGADLVTGAGRDPVAGSDVFAFAYVGGSLVATSTPFTAFAGSQYGVNVAAGDMGF